MRILNSLSNASPPLAPFRRVLHLSSYQRIGGKITSRAFVLRGKVVLTVLLLLGGAFLTPQAVRAQRIAKYGAAFLAGGVGARAIGMGGAFVALAEDVTAGYWNPAGLSRMRYPEIAYMHIERFAGVVSFDYAGGALPVNARSTVALSLFRSGVNDIVNTLNAWNAELGHPEAGYESELERFSAADYALFLSYARRLRPGLSFGVTGKITRRIIGDFASAWGYSADVGAQYRTGRWAFGATLQDVFTMFQMWSINPEAFEAAQENYEDFVLPQGGTELVLPVLRLGTGYTWPLGGEPAPVGQQATAEEENAQADHRSTRLTFGLGVDMYFDGQRAYVPNLGDISFHPRLGIEFAFRGIVALRAGINRVLYSEDLGLDLTPSIGIGLNLKQVSVDYAFGDFAGSAADLGYSHRISVQLRLEQPGLEREE